MRKHGSKPSESWRNPGHQHLLLHKETGCAPTSNAVLHTLPWPCRSTGVPGQPGTGCHLSKGGSFSSAGSGYLGIKAKGSGSCPTWVSYKSRVHCCIWFQPVGEVCCLYSCKAGRQSSPEGISNLFGLKGSAKPEDISTPTATPHSPYSGKQLSLGREKQCFPKLLPQSQKSGKFTIGLPYRSTLTVWVDLLPLVLIAAVLCSCLQDLLCGRDLAATGQWHRLYPTPALTDQPHPIPSPHHPTATLLLLIFLSTY